MLRNLLPSTLACLVGLSVYAEPMNEATTPAETEAPSADPRVKMVTSKGELTIQLFADEAPITVKNFLEYVEAGYYDGLIFHRIIPGFMAQGGGFEENMQQKKTNAAIKNEAVNGLKNKRGTLAMARTADINSATSQFFINLVDNVFLDHTAPTSRGYGYCVFGEIVDGMATVDAMASVKTATKGFHQNVPVEPLIIKSAVVITEAP